MKKLTVVIGAMLGLALVSTGMVLAATDGGARGNDRATAGTSAKTSAVRANSNRARRAPAPSGPERALSELAKVERDTSAFADRVRRGLQTMAQDRFETIRRTPAANGRTAYATWGEDDLCLVVREQDGAYVQGCAPLSDGLNPKTPLVATSHDPQSRSSLVTAIVPRGLTNPRVIDADRSSTALPIVSNIVSTEVATTVRALEFDTPDGRGSVSLEGLR